MQSYLDNCHFNDGTERSEALDLDLTAFEAEPSSELEASALQQPFTFEAHFQGHMFMHSEQQTVADYLNAHEGWFPTCAQPMHAEPLGNNGYVLTIGSFGAFGYEVKPKMGVVLEPPEAGIYNMHSVPVPDYVPPGYEVDYRAAMQLNPVMRDAVPWSVAPYTNSELTCVEWQLHLGVTIDFPQFIYRLPQHLIQATGDRLLAQIVRQISPRLTYKVQKDFHRRLNLPLPPRQSRHLAPLPASRQDVSHSSDAPPSAGAGPVG